MRMGGLSYFQLKYFLSSTLSSISKPIFLKLFYIIEPFWKGFKGIEHFFNRSIQGFTCRHEKSCCLLLATEIINSSYALIHSRGYKAIIPADHPLKACGY